MTTKEKIIEACYNYIDEEEGFYPDDIKPDDNLNDYFDSLTIFAMLSNVSSELALPLFEIKASETITINLIAERMNI